MTAAPRLGKKENTFSPDVSGEKLPDLLKVAAIYGGNASGKSNLLLALGMIEQLARRRPDAASPDLPIQPFRFDAELQEQPSIFEIHFVVKGLRYQYRVAATRRRIMYELLIAYPRGKEALLFSRTHANNVDIYKFGDAFEADGLLRSAWRSLTGPQSLFIAQAVANSSEDLRQLRTPFDWIVNGMWIFNDSTSQFSRLEENVPKDAAHLAYISRFLQDVDVPVTNIRFEDDVARLPLPEGSDASAQRAGRKVVLTHKTRLGSADFELSEESNGTRNLIGFWVPWVLMTMDRDQEEERFRAMVIDELDGSLHPEIVEHLISRHLASGAKTQLIFTTHDTHLMGTKILRRDQLWLTDRNSNGATRLTSIHSFEGREGEDVEKRYYEGRYRGLPIRRGK